MTWKPHVTVAAIIEHENQFLMVEEIIDGKKVINQPAGHLEPDETIIQAVIRETLEETAHHFKPEYLVGIYQWQSPNQMDFLRFTFAGSCGLREQSRELDPDIHAATWMNIDSIRQCPATHRSPLVQTCLNDYLDGSHYPLELLNHVISPVADNA